MAAVDKLKVVYRKASSLVPYQGNARIHPPEQIQQIRASIKEFGFTNPILLKDDGKTVGAGHGRLEAALQEGLEKVPTITLAGLSDAQWRAYVIADNQIGLNSSWDMQRLNFEIEALKHDEFKIELLGFGSIELRDIISAGLPDGAVPPDPDDAPEPPVNPVSRLGDVWILGNHRIICGSSTDPATVEKVLAGHKPNLMVTDPPYGVNYDPEWRVRAGVNTDTAASGVVLNDDNADWTDAWMLFAGDVAYVWHAGLHAGTVNESLLRAGFVARSQIIWAKSQMVMSRGDYHWHHEPCWYAVRKGKPGGWQGDRKQTTLWQIDKPHKSETGHSTQKPVDCMKRPIENNSKPGDYIYEPFSGSGTTVIAAEMTSRKCIAIELNPAYVDVCVKRWQDFAGKDAVLEGTAHTFAQAAAQRLSGKAA